VIKEGVFGLLLLATIFACMGVPVGYLGRHWWVFELASHFPVQYAAILLTSTFIYLGRAKYGAALVVGLFTLVNLHHAVPFNADSHAEASLVQSRPRTTDLRPWPWSTALARILGHSPHEIAARGVHKALTEKVISQGESPHSRTMPSVVRPRGSRQVVRSKARKIRALLINVREGNRSYEKVSELIRLVKPDFAVLLEVDELWIEGLNPIMAAYPYEKSLPIGRYGIALFSRIPFEAASIKSIGKAAVTHTTYIPTHTHR